jgi:ribosomal protein L11 methyltransferase
MKKNGFILFRFADKTAVAGTLDVLTELGYLEAAVDERDRSLSVLAAYEEREKLRALFAEYLPDIKAEEEFLEDRDWNREWIEGFQPLHIRDALWVAAPWKKEELPRDVTAIIINPGNAFGTGTHASTRLVLEILPDVLHRGDHILDLGCGSGILSIAARKLGAASVTAVDNDAEIRTNFWENVHANGMDQINLKITDVLAMDTFGCDLALINIQKHIILPLLQRFEVAKGSPKHVILAGLLTEHRSEVTQALEQQGYDIHKTVFREEWMAVSAHKRGQNEE